MTFQLLGEVQSLSDWKYDRMGRDSNSSLQVKVEASAESCAFLRVYFLLSVLQFPSAHQNHREAGWWLTALC